MVGHVRMLDSSHSLCLCHPLQWAQQVSLGLRAAASSRAGLAVQTPKTADTGLGSSPEGLESDDPRRVGHLGASQGKGPLPNQSLLSGDTGKYRDDHGLQAERYLPQDADWPFLLILEWG